MSNLNNDAHPVNADFRPIKAPPQITYWTDADGRVHVLLSSRRKADSYELIPLSTDIGGCAFRWFRSGAESYDLLLNRTDSSCSCAGWAYTGGCKHLYATSELLTLGVLTVAPGSMGADADDQDAA